MNTTTAYAVITDADGASFAFLQFSQSDAEMYLAEHILEFLETAGVEYPEEDAYDYSEVHVKALISWFFEKYPGRSFHIQPVQLSLPPALVPDTTD